MSGRVDYIDWKSQLIDHIDWLGLSFRIFFNDDLSVRKALRSVFNSVPVRIYKFCVSHVI